MASKITVKYSTAGAPTLARFHADNTRRRGVMGPVGSGKSTAMCMEIMRRAREQQSGPDGVSRTRWAVIRNTYRELKDTTVKTWLDWFPESVFGDFNWGDMEHRVRIGGDTPVEFSVLFRALDRPQDIAKLLSLEITGAWVNEARELPWGVIQALDDRIGRYPSMRDGGPTWDGMILDTNPPDDDHWWYRLAEEDRPKGWAFYRQPGGLMELDGGFQENPDAENLNNLPRNYYEDRQHGKSRDHVRVYYCARYGFVKDGKPVFPEYADDVHCVNGILQPIEGRTLYIGIDFGLTPAALIAQRSNRGRWLWLDELVTEDMGATRFAEELGRKLRAEYSGFDMEIYGDPAGAERSQVDERTPFAVLQAHGLEVQSAPTNDPIVRRDAVANPMTRMIDGQPGFMISPKCKVARKGLAGGFCLRRVQVVGEERYKDKPDKNRYSHVCEAGEYAHIGAGEGYQVLGVPEETTWDYDPRDDIGRSAVGGY